MKEITFFLTARAELHDYFFLSRYGEKNAKDSYWNPEFPEMPVPENIVKDLAKSKGICRKIGKMLSCASKKYQDKAVRNLDEEFRRNEFVGFSWLYGSRITAYKAFDRFRNLIYDVEEALKDEEGKKSAEKALSPCKASCGEILQYCKDSCDHFLKRIVKMHVDKHVHSAASAFEKDREKAEKGRNIFEGTINIDIEEFTSNRKKLEEMLCKEKSRQPTSEFVQEKAPNRISFINTYFKPVFI